MENAEVERQHGGDKNIEQDPNQCVIHRMSYVLDALEMKIAKRGRRVLAADELHTSAC
jgi:hypothetical protein